jgi:diadenosine tetraphosphate (Ap4A) HIT family hydrolase
VTGRYNIVVNVGKAGELSRMHVHVHLMPRYLDDVPEVRQRILALAERFDCTEVSFSSISG